MRDIELVELYWQRDERAIELTEELYGQYCHTVSMNIIGNMQDAEECVNDTWIRVWNAIPPAKPNDFKAFLARITRNLSIDRIKQRRAGKRNAVQVPLDELENYLIIPPELDEALALEHLQKQINRVLETVSERDRSVFVRRYFFFESIEQISSRYGLRNNHVAKILSRTRERMKAFLEKEGYSI